MNSTLLAYNNNPDGDTRIESYYNNPLCRELKQIIQINNNTDFDMYFDYYYNYIRNINLIQKYGSVTFFNNRNTKHKK